MFLAYFDESGDPGYHNSLTKAFALSCILVPDKAWLTVLDEIISFRRFLRDNFGLQPRAELKASYLIHNNGPFSDLNVGDKSRMRIYRMGLRLIAKLHANQGVRTFAIVVDKMEMGRRGRTSERPDNLAWERAIERLERFTTKAGETCALYPDEGNYDVIRSIVRRARRFNQVPSQYGSNSLFRPASFLVEDPSSRKSDESYFIQLADLVAYAAHRSVYPESWFDGKKYWSYLGTSRILEVSQYTRGTALEGIVTWPPKTNEKPPKRGAERGLKV